MSVKSEVDTSVADTETSSLNTFKEVAEIVGWLAGAVAAFSGILYVAGYLIIQTNRRLLGIDAPLTYSTEIYLQNGGSFMLDVGIATAYYVLGTILVLAIAALLFLVLAFPVALLFYPFKRRHVKDAIYRTRTRWIRMTKRKPWLWRRPVFWLLLLWKRWHSRAKRRSWVWRTAVFSLLAFVFVWHPLPQLEWVQATLEVSDLPSEKREEYQTNENPDKRCKKDEKYKLCVTNAAKQNAENECKGEYRKCLIKTQLIKQDTTWLHGRFEDALLATLVSGLLVFFVWRTVFVWRLRYLLTLPFMLMFITLFTLLPMVYGVLKNSMEFSPIEISFMTETPSRESGNLFLLNITGEELILWNDDDKKTLVVPKESVKKAEIKQRRFLFKPAGGN